jgi:hypothetical protein
MMTVSAGASVSETDGEGLAGGEMRGKPPVSDRLGGVGS